MEDKILRMFFDIGRWEHAIDKGVDKDIRKDQLLRLTDERTRLAMAEAMMQGRYAISPPHTAQIPKENGEYRTVYVNEPIDRIVLSIANDLLFDLMPEMVHPACKSYQRGIGCGKVVQEVSRRIVEASKMGCMGWKADLSKYFDSVPIAFVDAAFDKVEAKHGHSALIDVLRKYYHADLYFDGDNELHSRYQSLKQGCAVASWLANVLLYGLDEELSQMKGYYVRYSDDMLFIGEDYERAMNVLEQRLGAMSMRLNPKKVEYLTADKWFKFLGFGIRGGMISLSSSRIKTFQRDALYEAVIHVAESFVHQLYFFRVEHRAHNKNRVYRGAAVFSAFVYLLRLQNDAAAVVNIDALDFALLSERVRHAVFFDKLQRLGHVVRDSRKNRSAFNIFFISTAVVRGVVDEINICYFLFAAAKNIRIFFLRYVAPYAFAELIKLI